MKTHPADETRPAVHYHVYIAADDYRQGEYAPIAFLAITRKGFWTEGAAQSAARRREPDPTLRIVRCCHKPDCKMRKRPNRKKEDTHGTDGTD